MIARIFNHVRRPIGIAAGTAVLVVGLGIGTASSASAAPVGVSCMDGSRTSAAAIVKAEPRLNENNTVPSKAPDGTTLATIKLRYSPTYHCGWALIDGRPGDSVWIDRWQIPMKTWDGPLGRRDIQGGNSTTYTGAYTVPGYSIRACGVGYTKGHKPGTVVCTAWQTEDTLNAAGGSGGDGSTPAPPPSHPAADDGIVGDMFADSSQVECATGTKSVGVVDGYNLSTRPTRIRLCRIPNLPTTRTAEETTPGFAYYINGADGHAVVNARISGQVLKMVQAANAAGIQLTAESSFRTMPHQQHLYTCYGKHEPGCLKAAPPGQSNHQMGLALDFQYAHSYNTCSGGNASQDSRWKWLKKNAGAFGFRQLAGENWHWDTTRLSPMCS